MAIKIRKSGNVTILDVAGTIKLGDSEHAFRSQTQELLDGGTNQLAINLAGVPEMDSSGIGSLVRTFTSVKRAGGRCVFFSATKRAMMLLKMVRLDTVLEMAEDEPAALARF